MAITTFIYSLDCPITGNVKYIGKSDGPQERYRKHLEAAIRYKKRTLNNKWILGLHYKYMKPVLNIIDEVLVTEWQFWERHYISMYKSFGFKLNNGTNGGDGGAMGPEARVKMSNARKGKTTSDKQKEITSIIMKGNKHALGNTARRKEVVCFDTITGSINYYESSHAAGKELNILATSIRNNICGLSNVVSKRYKFYS